jgi:hypothetical protein
MIRMSRPPHRRPSGGLPATLLALASGALPAAAQAPEPRQPASYFVDFAAGSDRADGRSPETPWKRAPGDSRAGSGPRSVRLLPGDTVLFRGGVAYRGTIVVRSAGTAVAPIRYIGNGWGPAPALLDGSEPAIHARPCRSARDCDGEAGWARLHRLSLPGDTLAWDGVFQCDRPLSLATPGAALAPGTMRPVGNEGGRIVVVNPWPALDIAFASGAARVGFLLVSGGHVRIEGFAATRFAQAPRFGPYAGTAVVQLQPLPGITLASTTGMSAIRHAPPIGPAIAGVTSGPI